MGVATHEEGALAGKATAKFGDDSLIGDPLQLLHGKHTWPYTVKTTCVCDLQVLKASELRNASKMYIADAEVLKAHLVSAQKRKTIMIHNGIDTNTMERQMSVGNRRPSL